MNFFGFRLNAKISLWLAVSTLVACGDGQPARQSDASFAFQKQLQTQLLDAKPGDVIELPEGIFKFDRSLSLTVDNVTIRGAGMDKTILSFKDQIAGAEGMLVTASGFTIEDLAIEDTKGDALKINEAKNIVIRRIRTEWTNGPATTNGAYGIYPVQTEHVLIDGVVAIGASDAGIYVGQSRNVIVKNSRAEYNVAGIEIENTLDADVFNNVATNNTGGILVFNMPDLPQEGARTRVFQNRIVENNTANFAVPGGPVAGVPAGSGLVINSNDDIEIFDNDFIRNDTASIIISSVFSTGYANREAAADFDPYPERIYVHDNRYQDGGTSPDTIELKALKFVMFGLTGSFPNIIWDGYLKPNEEVSFCISGEYETSVLNVDAPNNYENPEVARDPYLCELPMLSTVKLPF